MIQKHYLSYRTLICDFVFAIKVRENYLQTIDNTQQAGPEIVLESQKETQSSSK